MKPFNLINDQITRLLFAFFAFGFAQAQLTLPKTLDDPGTSPAHTINWSDYSGVSSGFQFSQTLPNSEGRTVIGGTPHTATSTIRFAWYTEEDYSLNHYRLTYTDAENLTPVVIASPDTIPMSDNLQLQFTLDPFVALQQERRYPDDKQPVTPYFGEQVMFRFFVLGRNVPPDVAGTWGTPLTFSTADLGVLGDTDGHSLRLVQTGVSPELSVDFDIPAGADAQAVADAIQDAAIYLEIYAEGAVQEDGSLLVYADEALEIREATSLSNSKTLDDPGTKPSLSFSWLEGDGWITCDNASSLPSTRIYVLALTDDETGVATDETSVYTAAHPLYYVSDVQTTPVRLYENDTVLLADNPVWTLSLDPFVMAQHDNPLAPYFGTAIVGGEERSTTVQAQGLDTSFGEASDGTTGTAVTFTAAELTSISESDTPLTVIQTATGVRSSVVVGADADAQVVADAIREAAFPLTVYIHSTVEDDGSLSIFADEAITIAYQTATASISEFAKQGFSVYPNPAQQLLHIDSPQARTVTYTVYDLGGKRLLTDHQSGTAHRINVSDLSKGVYLLTAKLGNQNLVHRFVKE